MNKVAFNLARLKESKKRMEMSLLTLLFCINLFSILN